MTAEENPTKRVAKLFEEFRDQLNDKTANTQKLQFGGVGHLDVYNITAPFLSAEQVVIAGRVEPRDQEYSQVIFFEETAEGWLPVEDAPVFDLQDPFISTIHGELLFGGVQISEDDTGLVWKTLFYRGSDIFSLQHFFTGPTGMKDIRLCELGPQCIGVFTRPQKNANGRGKIGYTEIASLDELTTDIIKAAPTLDNMFHQCDWGGVNEARKLANGDIGLVAHVACFENDDSNLELHYYAASFIFSPSQRNYRELKVIAARYQLQEGPAKRPDLVDVLFPSGIIQRNGYTRLYVGVSDAEAHWIEIEDPFHP